MSNVFIWFCITLFCIAIQGFYSMLEMAAVSFNRVRLEYYVSKGIKRAIWLQYILQKPSRLFGTIMLGVNIALQIGSQSSREFYRAIGLSPDLAPVTQIFFVVILAELAPLFAARRFSEHVIMLGIPIVYATHRVFAPIIWFIGLITRFVHRLFGKKEEAFDVFLSREELQKVLESHDEESEFNIVVSNIFALRNKTASQVMTPLSQIEMIPSGTTIADLHKKLSESAQRYVPLFHKTRSNIVAVAIPRDFVSLPDNRYVRDNARPPWFITSSTKLLPILGHFRRNRQSVAVVLDLEGAAIGMLTLDAILEEIFGERPPVEEGLKRAKLPMIHRTFRGNTKISDFNKEYGTYLPSHGVETLAQLMISQLDHTPTEGDTLIVGAFELIAEETTLLGIKSITVKTLET
ncbi:MAG: HlyC/CorC family transporter [Chlamydiales bacterium]|nr:HlyC/CorC family transporter [Chlamydiales bacterium]